MPPVLPNALIIAALAAAALVLVPLVRGKPAGWPLLAGFALLEAALLVLAVIGIVNLSGTDREVDGATFVGYLIGSLAVLPVAVLWSRGESGRWGNAVLIAGLLIIPVLILRLNQIWSAHV
jgi:hypothetical protein